MEIKNTISFLVTQKRYLGKNLTIYVYDLYFESYMMLIKIIFKNLKERFTILVL